MSTTTGPRTIICERPNFVWERTICGVLYRFARSPRRELPGYLDVKRYIPEESDRGWHTVHSWWSPGTEPAGARDTLEDELHLGDRVQDPDGHVLRVVEISEVEGVFFVFESETTYGNDRITFSWAWKHWGPLRPCDSVNEDSTVAEADPVAGKGADR